MASVPNVKATILERMLQVQPWRSSWRTAVWWALCAELLLHPARADHGPDKARE